MTLHITSICIRYVKSEERNNKKFYDFDIDFKFKGAKRITGYVLDPKYIVVGQFEDIKEGHITISSSNLGYYKLVIVESTNVKNCKKIKFNIRLPKKHSSSSSSSNSNSSSSSCSESKSDYKIFNKKENKKSSSSSSSSSHSCSSNSISHSCSSNKKCEKDKCVICKETIESCSNKSNN